MKFPNILLLFILSTFPLYGQIEISGTVKSDDGAKLPGANIVLRGTDLGVVSDSDGNFTLDISEENYVMSDGKLVITYIGYITLKITISEEVTFYNIVLARDALDLSQVLVTGRGTISREALGVKVGTVTSNEIINSGESNIISSLSGKDSGVEITSSSGEPGSSTYIRIRGANTIQSSQQPLIVIDGSPIDNSTFGNSLGRYGAGQGATSTNRAMDINPHDIKSVEVLKGPAAASIYGTKAKNGVILINTKSGTAGENRITYRYTASNDRVTQQPKLNKKYGMGFHYGFFDDGGCDPNPDESWCNDFDLSWGPLLSSLSETDSINGFLVMADTLGAYYRNGQIFDHTSDIFSDGGKEEHALTFSGGNESTTYYINFSNMKHSGFFIGPNNFYNRQSTRLNLDQNVNKKLSIAGKMYFSVTDGSFIQMGSNVSGLLLGSYRTPPNFDNSVYLDPERGYHRSYINSAPEILTESHGYDNPFYILHEQYNLTNVHRFIGNFETKYTLNDKINFLYRIGTDYSNDKRRYIFPPSSSENPMGLIDVQQLSTQLIDHNFQLNANKDFGRMSTNFTIGQNLNGRDYSRTGIVGEKMSTYSFHQLNNTTDYMPDEYSEQIRTISTYFNLTFGLDNAYLTVGMNRDGSSTFGKGNRFSNFPRASFSWRFSDKFKLPSLSKGLLRAAWGRAGSEPDPYLTKKVFSLSSFSDGWGPELNSNYNGYGGFVSGTTKTNPNIKPELVTELEYGIDLAFLNDRLNFSLTSYKQSTEDAILYVPAATTTGYAYALKNAATIENNGLEISIEANLFEITNQSFSTEINYSQNNNIVTSLAGAENISIGGFAGAAAYAVEGEPYGVLRGNDWLYDNNHYWYDTDNDSYWDPGESIDISSNRNTNQELSDDIIDMVDSDILLLPSNPNFGHYLLDENWFPQMNPEETIIGDPNPDWLGSIRFSWNYKSTLRFSALFDIKYGGDIWNGTKGALYYFGAHEETTKQTEIYVQGGQIVDGIKTWNAQIKTWWAGQFIGTMTAADAHINEAQDALKFRGYLDNFSIYTDHECDASSTAIPCIVAVTEEAYYSGPFSGFTGPASQFIEDGSYMKLREISMSYLYTGDLIKEFGVQSLDFTLTLRNIFTWTAYSGIDPETNLAGTSNVRGLDYFGNPQARSILFTMTVNI